MSAIYVDNLCGICHNKPPDEDEDYNYECAFCKNFICSECFIPGKRGARHVAPISKSVRNAMHTSPASWYTWKGQRVNYIPNTVFIDINLFLLIFQHLPNFLFASVTIGTTEWTNITLSFFRSALMEQFLAMIAKYASAVIAVDLRVTTNEALIFA